MKALFYRHLQLAFALFVATLLIALGMRATLSWRNQQRIDMIQRSVEYTHILQHAGLDMRHLQVADFTGTTPLQAEWLTSLGGVVSPLTRPGILLVSENAARLQQVEALLNGGSVPARERLAAALELLRQTSYAEVDAVSKMLDTTSRDAAAESFVSLVALIVLPMLLVIALWLLLRRIFNPIDNLTELLLRLADGEPRPIPTQRVDPLLLPLFNNYNTMIARLGKLEEDRRLYAESLQAEVRAATQALLEQHQSLARAERLAAVGEVAANIAHELHNPLAGIQMALVNLRHDLDGAVVVERIDLIVAEMNRISRLLRGLLDQVRSAPEALRRVNLALLVHELIELACYQAPTQVKIHSTIADDVHCLLPDSQLRQALLNLVLNAIHAFDTRPGNISIAADKVSDILRLSVSDDGPGFPKEFLDERIQVFKTGRSSGTGLGLAMVRRFARDLGGKLELSNRKPYGACVTLILPCGAHCD
ncbi:Histidine kinase [Gammaproteobacteria bacterium]